MTRVPSWLVDSSRQEKGLDAKRATRASFFPPERGCWQAKHVSGELLLAAALLEQYSSFIFSCNCRTSFSPGGIQADVAFASMTAILLLGQADNVVQRGPAARSGTTIGAGGGAGLDPPVRERCAAHWSPLADALRRYVLDRRGEWLTTTNTSREGPYLTTKTVSKENPNMIPVQMYQIGWCDDIHVYLFVNH